MFPPPLSSFLFCWKKSFQFVWDRKRKNEKVDRKRKTREWDTDFEWKNERERKRETKRKRENRRETETKQERSREGERQNGDNRRSKNFEIDREKPTTSEEILWLLSNHHTSSTVFASLIRPSIKKLTVTDFYLEILIFKPHQLSRNSWKCLISSIQIQELYCLFPNFKN